MLRLAILVLSVCAVSQARMPFELAADVEQYLTNPIDYSFSCDGLPYGYYADEANNCQMFHICYPIADEIGGLVETAHFTFMCGNQTIFDQSTLTCNHPQDAAPCSQARTLWELSNADFGRIPEDNQRERQNLHEITFPDDQ